jgi:hypothetical protein
MIGQRAIENKSHWVREVTLNIARTSGAISIADTLRFAAIDPAEPIKRKQYDARASPFGPGPSRNARRLPSFPNGLSIYSTRISS